MIEQKQHCNQLPKEIKPAFEELKVLKHLKDAKINKKFGYTAGYLFACIRAFVSSEKLVSSARK